ncbi:hypothetical protein RDI58_007488 [Solanum bulbocastanum]|uniref:Uncharacterized protein n=1 Tax=Solanum bulbocastanum TaxID=147425 RepID=A0AAN8YIN8_SOLBU
MQSNLCWSLLLTVPLFEIDRARMLRSGLVGFRLHGSLSLIIIISFVRLWPFAHLITYGVIPVEQRLLWADCVELIWVTILSTYSNEESESRVSEVIVEAEVQPPTLSPSQILAVPDSENNL